MSEALRRLPHSVITTFPSGDVEILHWPAGCVAHGLDWYVWDAAAARYEVNPKYAVG